MSSKLDTEVILSQTVTEFKDMIWTQVTRQLYRYKNINKEIAKEAAYFGCQSKCIFCNDRLSS